MLHSNPRSDEKDGNDKSAKQWIMHLSTPLYFATTISALTAILLMVFTSESGFEETESHNPDRNILDDPFVIPQMALLSSVLTGPIYCFFWAWSFCIQTKWVHRETKSSDGKIRLGDDGEEYVKRGWVKKVLLSYNAWLAVALAASVGFSIWRLVENAGGRGLEVTTGFALIMMVIDW